MRKRKIGGRQDGRLDRSLLGEGACGQTTTADHSSQIELPSLKFIRGFSLFFIRGRGCYLSLLFQANVVSQRRNSKIVHSARGDFIIGLY